VSTCQQIVDGALRKLGKLGSGRTARAGDAGDALESLKGLYRSLINSGAFGRLRDVVPTADYTAGENERIFRNSYPPNTISLPALVADTHFGDPGDYGSRWVPPGSEAQGTRPPRDCSIVIVTDAFTGVTEEYLYDGHDHTWQSLSDLTLAGQAPLSRRDPDGLKAMLAMQFADEYGGEATALTARLAAGFQSSLTSRWSMPRRIVVGAYM
jgi:hypothetical protein